MFSKAVLLLVSIVFLISFFIGWLVKGFYLSNSGISHKEFEDLKTENLELRSEITHLKSPANDIETLRNIIKVHITESEEKNKKISEYENLIKNLESKVAQYKQHLSDKDNQPSVSKQDS